MTTSRQAIGYSTLNFAQWSLVVLYELSIMFVRLLLLNVFVLKSHTYRTNEMHANCTTILNTSEISLEYHTVRREIL